MKHINLKQSLVKKQTEHLAYAYLYDHMKYIVVGIDFFSKMTHF